MGYGLDDRIPSAATQYDLLAELSFLVFLTTVFLVPVAVRDDVAYVTNRYEWEPETWLWVTGAAIQLVNVVVVLAYVAKRNPDAPFRLSTT
ncbi:hypothetical protein AB7C87_02160 [Natrarchaeobius sp. A-rgal3]|uniref:hypothetical protein n=1 Tax=Natrarchaeobius versutus TaxID=1679078 RepID=UPI003510BE4A